MPSTLVRGHIPAEHRRVPSVHKGVCALSVPPGQRRRRRLHIEVVTPPVNGGQWLEILRGIDAIIARTQYTCVIRPIQHAEQRDRLFRTSLQLERSDGVLVLSLSPTTELLQWLRRLGAPAVLIDVEHPTVSSVVVDHEAAARMAVQHLIDLGHQRVALVDHRCDGVGCASLAAARQRGYRTALIAAGITPRQEHERRTTEGRPEAATAVLEDWLALPHPPTAVFAGSDRQALGVLEGAHRHGWRVPEDLALAEPIDTTTQGCKWLETCARHGIMESVPYETTCNDVRDD